MYLNFFGLDKQPFQITPDTTLFFDGSDRGLALEALSYAVENGSAITKVVGEVGSGKTMLCRMFAHELCHQLDLVYVGNPSISANDIVRNIGLELGLTNIQLPSKAFVLQAICDELLQRFAQGRRVVVLIEEAQSMPIETLEEVRLLSNLETNDEKLIQIVLFGQPELDDKLQKPQIRQFKERISHSIQLKPFKNYDIEAYLAFRLACAGYKGPQLFDQKIVRQIFRYSGGLARRINILADKILLMAFAEKRYKLTKRDVVVAAQDSGFKRARRYPFFLRT
jgi:type II secretory pathway predicted ATPase ExeA